MLGEAKSCPAELVSVPRDFSSLRVAAVLAVSQDSSSSPSLGDVARKLRKDTTDEVRMTDADTKKLFDSVDRIFAFAAEDTGMPKHATVKRRLVSKADVEKVRPRRAGQGRVHPALCPGRTEHEEDSAFCHASSTCASFWSSPPASRLPRTTTMKPRRSPC